MKKLCGFLGALAMLAVAPLARADFELTVNGVDCTPVVVSGNPNGTLTCNSIAVAPGVTIDFFHESGQQTSGLSQQFGTTLTIENTSGSAVTITLGLADSNFSSPTIPPASGINDASGLTINNTSGNNSASLVSCVDQSNGLILPTFCGSAAPGMAGPNAGLSLNGAGTLSNETFGTITTLGAPFSLSQMITVTLSAGSIPLPSSLNVTSSQVLTPVPEPISIALLGAVLALTSRAFRRKRSREGSGV